MGYESGEAVKRIAALNDEFRKTFRGGKVVMTLGIAELSDCVKSAALQEVTLFDDFSGENDPHGEHELGSFELVNRKFFWKIDYYDKAIA